MRAVGLVLVGLLLSACGDRRSFDERYQDTSKALEAKEKAIADNMASELADQPAPEPGGNQAKD
jgi:hypothetical protein